MKRTLVLCGSIAAVIGLQISMTEQAVGDQRENERDRGAEKSEAFYAVGGQSQGADVIVGDLPAVAHWTSGGAVNGMRGYSVATTSCNIGDEELIWQPNNTFHPVIGQNLYRLSNGRFEQIGMSWLKHGFCALQQNICGSCAPAGSGCPPVLGIGCSDPYGEFLNGDQPGLGPRFEVNPSTGIFQYPFSNPNGSSGNSIFKRIQVKEADLTVPGALYFVEGQYIHRDDAAAGNDDNNASYRRVGINGNFSMSVQGDTERELPAIIAWRRNGLGIEQTDASIVPIPIDVPDDGRFMLAYHVTDNGDGTWHYEIAVQNLNSHRSGGSFALPVGNGVNISNAGFKDVDYHSGEPFDGTDWSINISSNAITWECPQSFAENENANALRWGTLYNFWFDADTPPASGAAELGLFRPGAFASVTINNMLVPGVSDPEPGCAEDIAQNDGVVDTFDLLFMLEEWGESDSPADIAGDGSDEPDGTVDTFDLLTLIAAWGACE